LVVSGVILPWPSKHACLTTLLLACAVDAFQPGHAATLRSAPAASLRSCIVPTPELTPILAKPPAGPDEEEEDEDEDEDEAFDEEAIRGWLAPDGVTCIAFGGSVNAGLNADARAMPKGRVGSLRQHDVITFPITGIMKLDAVTITESWTVATGVTFAMRTGSEPALDRATVSIGPMKAGRDVSTFVFFDGADFAFSARTPARQAMMFAYTLQLTDSLSITAAIENPPDAATARSSGTPAAPGAMWPDMIGRLLYEGEGLTMHASGALRELRRADGRPARLASAFLLGASRDFEFGGISHTLLAQAGGTLGGPVFIGSQLDSTDALSLLTGGEIANGWSALASLTSEWTQTISTSAYASHYALRMPNRTTSAGRIDISRFAMNVVWKPAQMVKVGLEIGRSHSDVTLPRLALNGTSTERTTATIWLQKSF